MSKYHDYNHCARCCGINEIEIKDTINLHIAECKTKCSKCGFTDCWSYGFFESSCDGESHTLHNQIEKE